MSKHNNSLGNSSKGRCSCGRHMSLGEDHAGVSGSGYRCPDCKHHDFEKNYGTLNTNEEYYKQMGVKPYRMI